MSGYSYQNRKGLRVLCDWLDAPARYTRVKLECDDEAAAPKGLDDIVVERSAGQVHPGPRRTPALVGLDTREDRQDGAVSVSCSIFRHRTPSAILVFLGFPPQLAPGI
jgi:hypothetical protein